MISSFIFAINGGAKREVGVGGRTSGRIYSPFNLEVERVLVVRAVIMRVRLSLSLSALRLTWRLVLRFLLLCAHTPRGIDSLSLEQQ